MPLPISYPASIDALANPDASTYMDDTGFFGDEVIARIHDLLELLETRVGSNGATGTELLKSLIGDGAGLSYWDTYYRRNTVSNPKFDNWNGGTSFTASGPTADGWYGSIGTGGSPAATMSRQSHTLGDLTGLGEPTYFYRHVQSAQATSAQPYLSKRYLNVRQFAGRTVTVSFWAKCAATTVAVTPIISQNFGTGGSPSTTVATAASAVTVTTVRARFVRTIAVPAVTGKTIGSNADSYLELQLATPINATYTVDFDEVKVEDGSFATAFEGELTTKAVPTIFVAASNASDAEKNAAHVVVGGTADNVWLNAALSALPSSGGRVLVSTGLFAIAGQVATAKANTWIEGAGPGATIFQAVDGAGVNTTLISLAHVKSGVLNLTIDGNKASTSARTSMILCFGSATDTFMRNVWAINSAGEGVEFNTAGVRLDTVTAEANVAGGINLSGPSGTTSNQSSVVNCHARSNTTFGFSIAGDNVTVTGCTARANSTYGFVLTGTADQLEVVGCTAYGNTLDGFNVSSPGANIVGCIGNLNSANGFVLSGNDCNFAGCEAVGNSSGGFGISGGTRNNFVNCVAKSNGTAGFSVSSTFTGFIGCLSYLNGQVTPASGFGFDFNATDGQLVSSHAVQNTAHGVRCVGDRTQITANRIIDNGTATAATYHGIVVSANDCYMADNFIRKGSAAANKQQWGINIAGTNNKLGDNDLYDSGTAGEITDSGTNTRKPARLQASVAGGDTINTTASETNFATNITFPANTLFSVGKTLRVRAWGTYGTLGSGTVTLQFKLKAGTTTLLDFGSITTAISISGRRWYIDADITIAATGASGSFECAGHARIPTANDDVTASRPAVGSTTTVDTTASQALQISAQHGASNAANTVTMRQFIVDVRN